MPTVLFVHDKPRAWAKVGPILKKKGIDVREATTPCSSIDKAADLVIVDAGPDGQNLLNDLKQHLGGKKVVVVSQTAGPELPGVTYAQGGKLVDAVLSLVGAGSGKTPAASPAPGAEAEQAVGSNLEAVIASKTAKVTELRARGIDPFPPRFSKKDPVAKIIELGQPLTAEQHSGHELTTAGRVMQVRLMGKAGFFHVQDQSGKAQAYVRLDTVGEPAFDLFKDVHVGDFVGMTGEVFKTKTGEPTLAVKRLTLLAKALRPLPEKWHGLKDTEVRFRNRHLDLISNPEVRAIFEKRSKIVQSIRDTYRRHGYLEVETPILLSQAGGASATPFETFHHALNAKMVLRIATELYLKRCIIGGLDRVFEIGHVFRNEGIDTRHNPEFTMLESYGAYEDYNSIAALFEDILWSAAQAVGVETIEYRGQKLSLKPPYRRLYMPEMWRQYCGADLHDILEGKSFHRRGLTALARKLHIEAGDDTPSAKVFERIFDEKLLPHLAQPAFVMDHPTAITPLAKCKYDADGAVDPSIVERFEFFLGTEELSNAYTELNDPLDQRERLQEQLRQKEGGHSEADLLDEDFVQAMEAGMPPTGGIGIGIDRMCMVLTGHPSIREVILFPTLKPE